MVRLTRIITLLFSLVAVVAIITGCAGTAPTPTLSPIPSPTPASATTPSPTSMPTSAPTLSTTVTSASAPLALTLKSPLNGSQTSSLTPTLEWQPSAGDVSYGLQVATDQGFSNPIIDEKGLKEASYVVPSPKLDYGKTYYWRVGVGNAGGKSGWSPSWSFVVPYIAPVAPHHQSRIAYSGYIPPSRR